jgi:hypothetical protein
LISKKVGENEKLFDYVNRDNEEKSELFGFAVKKSDHFMKKGIKFIDK